MEQTTVERRTTDAGFETALKILNEIDLKDVSDSELEEFYRISEMKFGISKAAKSEDKILRQHQQTQELLNKFSEHYDNCVSIESVTLKTIAMAVNAINELALPLLEIWEIKRNFSKDDINDLLKVIQTELLCFLLTKPFKKAYSSNALSVFKRDGKKLLKRLVKDYNEKNPAHKLKFDEDYWRTLLEWCEEFQKNDENELFVGNMYSFFVSDFLENMKEKDLCSKDGRAWFFEQLFNIAFHTADYVNCVKNGIPLTFCYNYSLLRNNLDFSKEEYHQFRYNDALKSTHFSNAICKLAKELDINHLKILIDRYKII